jgi:hypothetical protein
MKRLRGRYFTVKHVLLTDCGHKMDMINEPRHRHCENCWFQWFNRHPQLIEVADQMFREQGKKAMEGLRGAHFVKMFVRYMATIIQFMKEEGRLPSDVSERTPGSGEQIQPELLVGEQGTVIAGTQSDVRSEVS